MKRIFTAIIISVMACSMTWARDNARYQAFGVAFYNLENLFDTIPNNPLGRDLEFTPQGKNSWGSKK